MQLSVQHDQKIKNRENMQLAVQLEEIAPEGKAVSPTEEWSLP